jgi:hypothetical protein
VFTRQLGDCAEQSWDCEALSLRAHVLRNTGICGPQFAAARHYATLHVPP